MSDSIPHDDGKSLDDEWDEELREREDKRRKLRKLTTKLAAAVVALCGDDRQDPRGCHSINASSTTTKTTRSPKRSTMLIRDDNGNLIRMSPKCCPPTASRLCLAA